MFPWLLMYAAVAAMAKVAGQVELELMGASGGARATAGGYALATRTAERTRPEPHRQWRPSQFVALSIESATNCVVTRTQILHVLLPSAAYTVVITIVSALLREPHIAIL